jgi:hypothetical protein
MVPPHAVAPPSGPASHTPPAALEESAALAEPVEPVEPVAPEELVPKAPAPIQGPRGSRGDPGGPFSVAPIVRHGVQIGWGGTCGVHVNTTDARGAQCKIQLTYGIGSSPIPDAECRQRMKAWLLAGLDVDVDDPRARTQHVSNKRGNWRSPKQRTRWTGWPWHYYRARVRRATATVSMQLLSLSLFGFSSKAKGPKHADCMCFCSCIWLRETRRGVVEHLHA